METKPTKAGTLKVGNYIMMQDVPCQITRFETSKTGGRGTARAKIEAVSLIDGRKRVELHSTGDNVNVPIIGKKTAQVLSVQGELANVMDTDTYETFDLAVPESLNGEVKEGKEILYWELQGKKILKQLK